MFIEIHSWKEDDVIVEQLNIDGNAEFTIATPVNEDVQDSLISCSDILGFIQKAHAAGIANSPLNVVYEKRAA